MYSYFIKKNILLDTTDYIIFSSNDIKEIKHKYNDVIKSYKDNFIYNDYKGRLNITDDHQLAKSLNNYTFFGIYEIIKCDSKHYFKCLDYIYLYTVYEKFEQFKYQFEHLYLNNLKQIKEIEEMDNDSNKEINYIYDDKYKFIYDLETNTWLSTVDVLSRNK